MTIFTLQSKLKKKSKIEGSGLLIRNEANNRNNQVKKASKNQGPGKKQNFTGWEHAARGAESRSR
uniref:Uncharacterized protein n=1 Tax=Arundo donax TaxID=35708 RepID=A0A0A9B1Q3_ARUDO